MECIRLADAALLQAKILRQDNPTPKAAMDIDGILEGVAAVYACEEIIGLTESMELMHFSYIERWTQRIHRNRKDNQGGGDVLRGGRSNNSDGSI